MCESRSKALLGLTRGGIPVKRQRRVVILLLRSLQRNPGYKSQHRQARSLATPDRASILRRVTTSVCLKAGMTLFLLSQDAWTFAGHKLQTMVLVPKHWHHYTAFVSFSGTKGPRQRAQRADGHHYIPAVPNLG
jgi:hypothetical protein